MSVRLCVLSVCECARVFVRLIVYLCPVVCVRVCCCAFCVFGFRRTCVRVRVFVCVLVYVCACKFDRMCARVHVCDCVN